MCILNKMHKAKYPDPVQKLSPISIEDRINSWAEGKSGHGNDLYTLILWFNYTLIVVQI